MNGPLTAVDDAKDGLCASGRRRFLGRAVECRLDNDGCTCVCLFAGMISHGRKSDVDFPRAVKKPVTSNALGRNVGHLVLNILWCHLTNFEMFFLAGLFLAVGVLGAALAGSRGVSVPPERSAAVPHRTPVMTAPLPGFVCGGGGVE